MRRFEVAKKIVNGQCVGMWDVSEENMPEYATRNAAGADFRAAEDVVVKSIWGQAMKSGISDTTRNFTNSIKDIFGSQKYVTINEVDQNEAKRAMEPTLIHTGIKAYMEEDEVLYICNRSSGPKKLGLVLANSIGVIDADYADNPDTDGEIMFAFYNFFPFDITIKKGDKIGQGIFQKFLRADNARIGGDRVGGFGSTDNVSSGETVQPSTGGVNLSKESEQSKFSGLEGLGEYTTGKFASFGTGTQEEDNTQNQTTFHLEK